MIVIKASLPPEVKYLEMDGTVVISDLISPEEAEIVFKSLEEVSLNEPRQAETIEKPEWCRYCVQAPRQEEKTMGG